MALILWRVENFHKEILFTLKWFNTAIAVATVIKSSAVKNNFFIPNDSTQKVINNKYVLLAKDFVSSNGTGHI